MRIKTVKTVSDKVVRDSLA